MQTLLIDLNLPLSQNEHVPSYMARADAILAAGASEIICFSVSDPYAMQAWAETMGVDQTKISFLCDPDGSVTAKWGLAKDYSGEFCSGVVVGLASLTAARSLTAHQTVH